MCWASVIFQALDASSKPARQVSAWRSWCFGAERLRGLGPVERKRDGKQETEGLATFFNWRDLEYHITYWLALIYLIIFHPQNPETQISNHNHTDWIAGISISSNRTTVASQNIKNSSCKPHHATLQSSIHMIHDSLSPQPSMQQGRI